MYRYASERAACHSTTKDSCDAHMLHPADLFDDENKDTQEPEKSEELALLKKQVFTVLMFQL